MKEKKSIKCVAVLGAGVMGSQIAALLANKKIKTYLFDISKKHSSDGRNRLKSLKPEPLDHPENIESIMPCSYDNDIEKIKKADLVLEVVAESLEIKRKVYDKILPFLKDSAILTTNTSGIPLKELSQKLSKGLKRRFMATHFFNPPRYMKLLELVKDTDTSKETFNIISNFGENILNKGIVPAKDTPNFIGNRVGIFSIMSTINIAIKMGVNIETVDNLTGPISGRPKSATFRTADIIGLDVLKSVAMTTYKKSKNDESINMFKIPDIMDFLIHKGNLGQKTKSGFYQKDKNGTILVLGLDNKQYSPISIIETGIDKNMIENGTIDQRINALINLKSKNGEFFWDILSEMLLYCANRIPEISDNIKDIDNAMKWGFGWEAGPFELWDMIGLAKSIKKMKANNKLIPIWIEKMLIKGGKGFYI